MQVRMLFVDDEDSIGFAMRRFFEFQGYRVDWARELEEAQALLANATYDVVVCDLRLTGAHGAEGLEIVSHVRKHFPNTRTVMLTAHGNGEVEKEARIRGVDLFRRKPYPLQSLCDDILELLRSPR